MYQIRRCAALTAAAAMACALVGQAEPNANEVSEDQARQALRDTFAHYRSLDGYSGQTAMSADVKSKGGGEMFAGMAEAMKQSSTIHFARPDKLFIKSDQVVAVRHGDKLALGFPMMMQYIEEDADESALQMLSMMSNAGGAAELSLLGMLTSDEQATETFVNKLKDVKAERTSTDDGERLHISALMSADDIPLEVELAGLPVEIWIDPSRRVFTKHRFDLTEYMNQMMKEMAEAQAEALGGGYERFALTTDLQNQQTNPEFDDAAFAFDWDEAGYSKGDPDDFAGMFGLDESDLVGQDAPDIQSETVDGESFKLSDLRGNVVLLDFWATWCGPCVKAIPKIQKLHEQFEGKPVRVLGINQDMGNVTKVKAFLEKKSITFTQVMDARGEIGKAYEVQGIPTTVLIDQKGVIQTYDVGFMPGHEKEVAEHIEKLLNGESLVTDEQREKAEAAKKESATEQAERPADEKSSMRLDEKLSFDGSWWAVVTDQSNATIIAAKSDGRCAVFDSDGNQIRKFELRRSVDVLRSANLTGDATAELLNFGVWHQELTAHDQTGKLLWSCPIDHGIDDVWPGDLDGDGYDEVVVGFNGAGGLQVLDRNGKLLWKNKRIGNCWHVGIADIAPNEGMEVFTTSADGLVHVFDAHGGELKTLRAGQYSNMVRAMFDGTILAATGGMGDPVVTTTDYDGSAKAKKVTLKGAAFLNDAIPAPNRRWIAVAARNESVYVIDVAQGRLLAELEYQGNQPHAAWLSRSESDPWLLVANGAGLKAYALAAGD